MDLSQIRCFMVVAQEQNVSRAADRLHITQPALSRKIQTLEDRLGVSLIERHGRGIRLTRAAEELLPRFSELVSRAEGIRDLAGALGEGAHRLIRIGATPHFIETLLSKALGPFLNKHPDVEVVLVEGPSEEFRERLEHNDIHLAVGARRFSKPFRIRPLPPIPVLAVFPRDHPLRGLSSIEIIELVNQPLLLLRRGFLTREVFESACQLSHVVPNIKHQSQSLNTILSLVKAGYGVGIVPGNANVKGRFASLLQDGRPVSIETAAAWNPHTHLPAETDELIDALEETMREKTARMRRDSV